MTSFKTNFDKFDDKKDFSLWKIEMEIHLENLGLDEALSDESEMSESVKPDKKA